MSVILVPGSTTLYRGPQPEAEADFDLLQKLGIKVVLDLQWRAADLLGIVAERLGREFMDRGIHYWPLPILPLFPPRRSQLDFCVEFLGKKSVSGTLCYVHCYHGVDRTGMVVAAYRHRMFGESYETVKDDMLANGFHRYRFGHWLPFLKAYCER